MLFGILQFQYQPIVWRNSAAFPESVGASAANWLRVRSHTQSGG